MRTSVLSQIYCRSAHTGSMSETLNLDNEHEQNWLASRACDQDNYSRTDPTTDARAASISVQKGFHIRRRACARSAVGCTPWTEARLQIGIATAPARSPLPTMATPECHGHKCPAPTAVAHGGDPATDSPIRRSIQQIRRQRAIRMLHYIEDICAKWPERTYQAFSSHRA